MIINIRGTSGSGKSTIVRQIMELYDTKDSLRVSGRKRPIAYRLTKEGHRPLVVLGHYETACGGCDTISQQPTIFQLVRTWAGVADVLFEGLLISAEVNNTAALYQDGLELRVYALTTDVEQCLDSVNMRRRARMGDKFTPVKEKATRAKFKGVQSSLKRLRDHRVTVREGTRTEVLTGVLEELGFGE